MKLNSEIIELPLKEVLAIRQEVMYPGKSIELANVQGDETAIHWGLQINNKTVSVISLFDSEKYGKSLQFRKFATLTIEQGKGYGTMLLNAVVDYAVEKRYQAVWCNARLTALSWYQKFGFQQEGHVWNKNGIDYIILYKHIH
ncbi:GNAT family N-acetyltransferase [Flavihumibacter sp. UBA7668]|uniref:GNAT family N-acetyltransferase n=1 Tax=Flavihumibacter sp. UBA7668 TaxID=1946542 RepID=UPI0025BB335A|nr:GNAT family N-acetyltransferase [Flavihumibacter sp. UBA7668]